jgi:hypothetical protein
MTEALGTPLHLARSDSGGKEGRREGAETQRRAKWPGGRRASGGAVPATWVGGEVTSRASLLMDAQLRFPVLRTQVVPTCATPRTGDFGQWHPALGTACRPRLGS